MALFPQEALNDGVRKREVFGWAMYDFANSGYTTVVLTAVFNTYFVGVAAQGADWGTLAWTLVIAASSLIVMVTMPALGAYADLHARKKALLAMTTAACVAGTAALALVGRGDLWLAVAAMIVSNVCYSYGESLTAAFLPELARTDSMGRVSGWGWSFGYFGGMLSLGLCLAYVLWAQARGIPATEFVPVTMLITAAVYGGASLATFMLLRERAVSNAAAALASETGGALKRLLATARRARELRDFAWLLACGASYQAGISVVIALAAVYAEQVLGFKQAQTMMLVFLVNMTVLAVLAQGPGLFWVAAVIAGLCMGSSQSAGRAMAGVFAPEAQRAEFYGLWTFATRVSAIVGPLTYGLVTWWTGGNHRLAILSTAVFFVFGLLLLIPVNVGRGIATAQGKG
jgi:MFS transporter, UMF1 family